MGSYKHYVDGVDQTKVFLLRRIINGIIKIYRLIMRIDSESKSYELRSFGEGVEPTPTPTPPPTPGKIYTFTIIPTPEEAVVIMNGEEHTAIGVESGTEITWSVSADGYATQEGTHTVTEDKTLEVTLEKQAGMFFIVDGSTEIAEYTNYMYSLDGINWESSNFPYPCLWKKVVYGNGIYLAVGGDDYYPYTSSDKYAYSSDGINWNVGTFPRADLFVSCTFGNGVFVVVSRSTKGNLYSSDGINWNTGNLNNSFEHWGNVVFNNGMFHALASEGRALQNIGYSIDGSNWSYCNVGTNESWSDVAYGNEIFTLTTWNANLANLFRYSSNGTSWAQATQPAWSLQARKVCFFKNKFIGAGGISNSKYQDMLWESTDGKTWQYIARTPIKGKWTGIANNNDICVLSMGVSNSFCYSFDNENWTSSTLPLTFTEPRVFFAG